MEITHYIYRLNSYDYFNHFSTILTNTKKETINKNCFSLVEKLSFKDSLCNETVPNYAAIAYFYVLYYNLNSFPVGEKDKHFKNLKEVYSTIKKSYTGILKDQMLHWSIEDYAGKDCPSYDSIYNAFLSDCKNEKIRLGTISKVAELKKLAETVKAKKMAAPQIEYSKVLSDTYIKNIKGEKVKLQDILSDEIPTLIDCWASWCGPCISNIPTVKLIEKKYKGKIKVLYLSFDKDELKWSNYLKTNPGDANNEYIIENNFSSLFAGYFNLKSIPRYIFLSHRGMKIIDDNMILNLSQTVIENELNN